MSAELTARTVDGVLYAGDPRVPLGFARNPSAWRERLPQVVLALAGALVAGYLTLVQVHVLGPAWEPLFADGSQRVLHSSLSRALPVPDAGLGLLAYVADVVLGLVGRTDRWRTRPWPAYLLALVVLGAAAGGLALAVVQAVVVRAFCTLCLTTAALSVAILAVNRLREARAALAARRL